MKKTYMKPSMESEMFVSNEYVATCWKGYCNEKHIATGNFLGNKFDVTNDLHVAENTGTTGTIKSNVQPSNTTVICEDGYQTFFWTIGKHTHTYVYKQDNNLS